MILSVATLATMTTTVTAKSELATLKGQMAAMNQRLQVLETQESTVQHTTPLKAKKYTKVKSKAPVLQFSGKHYLGFVSDKAGSDRKNYFETRRNNSTTKTPIGMFEEFRIPNNLQYVIDKVTEYEN